MKDKEYFAADAVDSRRYRAATAICRERSHDSANPSAPCRFCEHLAATAISAYENEPEPTPQLLVDMAKAMYNQDGLGTCWEVKSYDSQRLYVDTARAALGVVVRQLYRCAPLSYLDHESRIVAIEQDLGIPESLVIELLDGK